jgi:hypothetical protein
MNLNTHSFINDLLILNVISLIDMSMGIMNIIIYSYKQLELS